MTDLFTPFKLGQLALPNRILMSAMTRTRAGEDGVPTDLMRDYYVQRASAGLIVTECTQVSDQGHGIIRCPGIHREDQVAGWRKVTDAVHAAGGRIICQVWHCGRVAHPDMRGGEPPVGPSPIPATGDFFLPSGRVEFPVPRELRLDEIPGIVASFAAATRKARAAGFDGVELHGANGYLQDQFLQDGSNQRRDVAKAAKLFGMPILMTTSQEDRVQGPTADALQRVAPEAYAARVKRTGVVNAWSDPAVRDAVLGLGRRQLVMAAVTTDICLVFPAISAVEEGFEVQAVLDASGSPFDIGEETSRRRMERAGVWLTSTNTMITELVGDWSTKAGQEMMPILFASAPMFPVG